MNNKGFTLIEILVATAIGALLIVLILNIQGFFSKEAKNIELKENTRVLIDKELMAMSYQSDFDQIDKVKFAESVCGSLGLQVQFDGTTSEFNCMVKKSHGCKEKSPCLITIKESLCELQTRSFVSIRHACSL